MRTLNEIKDVVKEELDNFNNFFSEALQTNNKLLNILLKYLFRNKGKQIRPLLVFLSAKLVGDTTQNTNVAATLIELLHTATLVHDDVVDNSELRRSVFSLKALWKSKVAVLVGDYLLSQGLLLSVKYKSYKILETVSEAVKEMSEGELLQLEKARKMNFNPDSYYEIIGKKTASLIKASTKSGALSATNNFEKIELLADIGWNIGMAFQIKDDLFDYENDLVIGKPGGNDIQEGKITLPVIYTYNELTKKDKRKFVKLLSAKNKSKDEVAFIKAMIKETQAIELTKNKMLTYSNNAVKMISENFPSSLISESFIDLIRFVVNRKK